MKPEIGEIFSLSLENGIEIYVCQNNKAPIATFQSWVKTGSMNEGKYLGSGLSHFLEHMVFKGTEKYTRDQITSGIDRIGGRINAYTSYSKTVYYANAPSAKIAEAADIIMDLVRYPIFPEAEFKNEKDVILRERAMRSDSPDAVLFEHLMASMFIKNPMRHPIVGYSDKILQISRDDLIEYHRMKYKPANMIIVACGALEPEKIFDLVKNKLEDWKNFSYFEDTILLDDGQRAARKKKFYFKDPLARIAIAYHTVPNSNELSPAFDVLSFILGGSESSRLTKKFEREEELAVGISCAHHSSNFTGILCVSATAEHSKFDKLCESIHRELTQIVEKNPPTENEVKRVVNQISVDFLKSLRSIDSIASLVGNSVLLYQDPNYALRYLEILQKLSPEIIREAASCRIKNDNSTTVIMLDEELDEEKKIKPKSKANTKRNKIEIIESESIPAILFLPDNTLPLFDVFFVRKAGLLCESSENVGISSIFTSALLGGTAKFNEEKILELIDDNAIDLSFDDGRNSISASCTAPCESFDIFLELFFDIFNNPIFPLDVIEREKNIELNSLASEMMHPLKAATEKINKIIYKNHPYSLGIEKKLNSIPKLSRNSLLDFYHNIFLSSSDVVFALSGKISDKEFDKFISAIRSIQWKNRPISEPQIPVYSRSRTKNIVKLPRAQSVVTFTFPACGMKSEDRQILDIASASLNGMNSSLFKRIREENGLAYYTGFGFFPGIECGHITVYAGVAEENIEKTVDIFNAERNRMINDAAVSEEEFLGAREKILFHISEMRANSHDWIIGAATEHLFGYGLNIFENAEEILKSITINQINQTVAKYLSASEPIEVIVIPDVNNDEKSS